MRISDWSSDVCSSDLEATAGMKEGDMLPGETAFRLYDTYGFPYDLTEDALRAQSLGVDRSGFDAAMAQQRAAARAAWKEIGRASWRERGGRNVEISVVAVSIKKK